MSLSAPIFRLKRQARRISRDQNIPLHAALDSVARGEGYSSWSLLASEDTGGNLARGVLEKLVPGDLLLLAARPRQGKTLMALKIALEAIRSGRRAVFFSLEYTKREVGDRLATIGADWDSMGPIFTFDSSDDICASYIISALAGMPPDTVVFVDYLQLLDQKRENPDLPTQIAAIKRTASETGITFIFISQIDRSFETSSRDHPDLVDVRLPNPLDLTLFTKACFLNEGRMRFVAV